MGTEAATETSLFASEPAAQTTLPARVAGRLFRALAPLHGLQGRDAELLERAAAGQRFIRAVGPFGENERVLMRIALADLSDAEAFAVEASASYAADCVFEEVRHSWGRLGDDGRRRVLWFAGVLRLAESLEAVCCGDTGVIYAAWTDELLHIEIDEVALSSRDVDRVLDRVAALEVIAGRRVLFTSWAG